MESLRCVEAGGGGGQSGQVMSQDRKSNKQNPYPIKEFH